MALNTKTLKDVETSQPVIEDGIYHARLSCVLKENNAKTGNNLVLTHEIIDPANRKDTGEPVGRSIKITQYISLVPTEKYDPDENLRRIAEAVGHNLNEPLELEHIEGMVCRVVIGSESDEKYGEQNRIKKWEEKDPDFIVEGM